MSSDNFPFEFYAPTLKEFRIEKLFNKYNVTIRLKDKCFVLIGPNGVGKSTIMKILYNFISGNGQYLLHIKCTKSHIIICF